MIDKMDIAERLACGDTYFFNDSLSAEQIIILMKETLGAAIHYFPINPSAITCCELLHDKSEWNIFVEKENREIIKQLQRVSSLYDCLAVNYFSGAEGQANERLFLITFFYLFGYFCNRDKEGSGSKKNNINNAIKSYKALSVFYDSIFEHYVVGDMRVIENGRKCGLSLKNIKKIMAQQLSYYVDQK